MKFQFTSDYVPSSLPYLKWLIIINYQSLNYAVKLGCVLSGDPYL